LPDAARPAVEAIRRTIREAVPEATEGLSYGVCGFRLDGRPLMYCAGWPRHVAVYPIPPGDADLVAAMAPHVAGKGTLRFALTEPVALDLVARIARAHVARVRGGTA